MDACPRFEQYLQEISGGNECLIARFWEAIGYALVPDNRAKRFFLLQKMGDTGKSVLGSLLGSFFDKDAVSR